MTKETIFHKIIKKEIPAYILYEDKDICVILDAFPNSPGHSLVLPKTYSENLIDIDDSVYNILMLKAKKVAKKIINKLNVDGFSLVINNHHSSHQKVFYTHVHIIPAKCSLKKTNFDEIKKLLSFKSLD